MFRLLLVFVVFVLAGCAAESRPDYDWAGMEEDRRASIASMGTACESDLCRYVVAREFNARPFAPPRKEYHPAWNILANFVGAAVPAYLDIRNTETWGGVTLGVASAFANADRSTTDNSVMIGGDLIGRDRIDDRSTEIGDGFVGGDQRIGDAYGDGFVGGDQRIGDETNDSCIGDSCRNVSPGPIDESDNSLTNPTPDPEPEPEPEPEPDP